MWNFRRLALLSSCFPLIMIISTTLLKGFPLISSLKALFPFHSLNSRESMQLISTFFFFRFVSFADLKLNRPLCTWTKSPIHDKHQVFPFVSLPHDDICSRSFIVQREKNQKSPVQTCHLPEFGLNLCVSAEFSPLRSRLLCVFFFFSFLLNVSFFFSRAV